MTENREIRPNLLLCRSCIAPAVFDVSMRHGAEYPACREHVAKALDDAFEHDGDHGHVSVDQIGVSSDTTREVVMPVVLPSESQEAIERDG